MHVVLYCGLSRGVERRGSSGTACCPLQQGSGEKAQQLIYSLFDPIRPMSTFVSTALGNVSVCVCVSVCICVFKYCRKIEQMKEREEGGKGGGGG